MCSTYTVTRLSSCYGNGGIIPIQSEYDTYLTTIFAREDSRPHRLARSASENMQSLADAKNGWEVSKYAGERFIAEQLQRLAADNLSVIAISNDNEPLFETLVRAGLSKMRVTEVLSTSTFGPDAGSANSTLKDFDGDALIICTHNVLLINEIQSIVGAKKFPIVFRYFYPAFFLFNARHIHDEEMFHQAIHTAADIPGIVPPSHEIFPPSSRAASTL
jgi:hypothetical protein